MMMTMMTLDSFTNPAPHTMRAVRISKTERNQVDIGLSLSSEYTCSDDTFRSTFRCILRQPTISAATPRPVK